MDGVGAVGECRHRLRAADAVDLVHAGNLCGEQDQRVENAIWRGHDHGEPPYPRDFGGDRVHQDRAGVAGQPTRHVKARGRDGGPAPAQRRADIVGPLFVLWQLAFVVGAYAGGGKFECGFILCADLRGGGGDFGLSDAQGVRGQRDAVEFFGEVDHRLITACANVSDDPGHGGVHVGAVLALGVQQGGEGGIEIGGGGVEEYGHGGGSCGWSRS